MTSANEVIIAAAGAGKTQRLIDMALKDRQERVLITTYTRENMSQIEQRLWSASEGVMDTVSTMTWFEFLLRHGVKPYQTYKTEPLRIRSIDFINKKPKFKKREDFDSYYLDSGNNIYSDAVSDLACVLNFESQGKVISRLEQLYDTILIDEMQDLAGWDLEFVELLLASHLRVILVGDPRQAVYLTNRSPKNSSYRGTKILDWIDKLVRKGLCIRSDMSVSYRCTQAICDFADKLFPLLPQTKSAYASNAIANGIHLVKPGDVPRYRQIFHPQSLRWDRRNKKAGVGALNFGDVKGREYSRVLIYPTNPILKYLENGESLQETSRAKFYVAITRASDSVGIVTEEEALHSSLDFWSPEDVQSSSVA